MQHWPDEMVSMSRASTKYCNKFFAILSHKNKKDLTQPAFTCSKLATETLKQGVKYVQS